MVRIKGKWESYNNLQGDDEKMDKNELINILKVQKENELDFLKNLDFENDLEILK